MTVIYCALVFLVCLLTRLAGPGSGLISGHALLCREQLRSRRKLPIRLPDLFSLEEAEQYGPPGWAIALALFPDGLALRRPQWLLALLDAALAVGLYIGMLCLALPPAAAFAAAVWVSLAPLAARPDEGSGRSLGPDNPALPGYEAPTGLVALLAAGVVLPACAASVYGLWWPWVIALFAGFVLLFTSFQVLPCLLLGLVAAALFTGFWELAVLPPLLIAIGIAVSAGLYVRLARARYALLRSMRGSAPKETKRVGRLAGKPNPRGIVLFCLDRADLAAALAVLAFPFPGVLLPLAVFGAVCGVAAICLDVLGIFQRLSRDLRGCSLIGTLPCLAALWAVPFAWAFWLALILTLAACCRGALYLAARSAERIEAGEPERVADLARRLGAREAMYAAVAETHPELLLVLPSQLADEVAWRCRTRVCWGGHAGALAGSGAGPNVGLRDIFPRPNKPLPELCRELGISHVLVDMELWGEAPTEYLAMPLLAMGGLRLYAAPPEPLAPDVLLPEVLEDPEAEDAAFSAMDAPEPEAAAEARVDELPEAPDRTGDDPLYGHVEVAPHADGEEDLPVEGVLDQDRP